MSFACLFPSSCYGEHVEIVYRICFSQMAVLIILSLSHAHVTHTHTLTHLSLSLSLSLCLSLSLSLSLLLSPVVIIMIAAVVHYASKRCGSYTVNPDPEKSNGAPSWISVSVGQSSNSAAPPAINHYATTNGHSNGHSYRTKSFRGSSPTCSTHSFT